MMSAYLMMSVIMHFSLLFQAMAETIGFNAATVLDKILPNTYRESFEKILIPSYEKSCREMFIQISKEFEKGTRNCKHLYFDGI